MGIVSKPSLHGSTCSATVDGRDPIDGRRWWIRPAILNR
jgi:hypothetical protein